VPRAALTEQQLSRIQPYCDGDYVEPNYGFLDFESYDLGILKAESNDAHLDEQDTIQLRGGVQVQQGPWWMEADSVDVDKLANSAEIRGNIKARVPGMLLRGESAEYDLETSEFSLNIASYLLHDRHARGQSGKITSQANEQITIHGGGFTTCSPFSNDWQIKAADIFLDRQAGEGVARHMRLEVKDIPVFYLPYLKFPIDDRRRSGFFYPTISNSSAGSGLDIGIPYYFNLAENYDLTYAPRYIHGRGLLSEAEGRWLTERSYTELRLGLIFRDSEYLKDVPFEDRGDRWALDITNESNFGANWTSELDYNVVSDNDYLDDLNRTLEIQKESHIKRFWNVAYKTGQLRFNSRVLGYQTIDDDIAEEDQPYSLLPQLDVDWTQQLAGLDVKLQSEFSYFWRNNDGLDIDERTKGSRWRTQPELALNLQSTWGFFKPGIRIDHTDYLLQDQPESSQHHISRTVPFFRIDSGIFLDRETRIFDVGLVQSLEPRVFYLYSPEIQQDDVPVFDSSVPRFDYSRLFAEDRFTGGDRVGDNHQITVGLQTRLRQQSSGLEVFRAGIGQIFYLEPGDVFLSSSESDTDGQITEKESPYAADVLWKPNPRVDVRLTGVWDPQQSQTESGASSFSFHSEDYRKILNLGHRYRNDIADSLEQSDISVLFPVSPTVNIFGRWLFDLQDKRTIGTLAGIEYSTCCWRVQLLSNGILEDRDGMASELEHGFFLRFQLRGLGGIGTGDVDSALDNAIRNMGERRRYREENFAW